MLKLLRGGRSRHAPRLPRDEEALVHGLPTTAEEARAYLLSERYGLGNLEEVVDVFFSGRTLCVRVALAQPCEDAEDYARDAMFLVDELIATPAVAGFWDVLRIEYAGVGCVLAYQENVRDFVGNLWMPMTSVEVHIPPDGT